MGPDDGTDEEGFVGLSDEAGEPLDLESFISGWGFDPDPEDTDDWGEQ